MHSNIVDMLRVWLRHAREKDIDTYRGARTRSSKHMNIHTPMQKDKNVSNSFIHACTWRTSRKTNEHPSFPKLVRYTYFGGLVFALTGQTNTTIESASLASKKHTL